MLAICCSPRPQRLSSHVLSKASSGIHHGQSVLFTQAGSRPTLDPGSAASSWAGQCSKHGLNSYHNDFLPCSCYRLHATRGQTRQNYNAKYLIRVVKRRTALHSCGVRGMSGRDRRKAKQNVSATRKSRSKRKTGQYSKASTRPNLQGSADSGLSQNRLESLAD